MKSFVIILFIVMSSFCYSQIKSAEIQILESTRALPESMRENSTVIGYNQSGERIVLRNGTNDMICWADNPSPTPDDPRGAYFVVAFPKSLKNYMNRIRDLKISGNSTKKAYKIVATEIKDGKIKMPEVSVRYTLRGAFAQGALSLTIIHVPFCTPESTGFSDKIDNFRPWLMSSGTAHAHIMVPGH